MNKYISFEACKRRFPEAKILDGKNGIEYAVNCTKFHRKGGRYKLNINATSGGFYCQDCGFTGNARREWFDDDDMADNFEHLRISRDEEFATILKVHSTPSGNFARRGEEMWENNMASPGKLVPFASLPGGHPAVEYMADRGFDIVELNALPPCMALQYCTNGISMARGTTTGRIVFPIYMGGILKGWQARKVERVIPPEDGDDVDLKEVWGGEDWKTVGRTRAGKWQDHEIPKYLTCPGMSRADILYGYDQARNERPSDNQLLVVVEGPLDQLKVGYPSVASLGGLSDHQLRVIVTYWETVVIIRDPDIDPESAKFRQVLARLSAIKTCHLALPNGKDAGGSTREEIWTEIAKEMARRNYELPLSCQRN